MYRRMMISLGVTIFLAGVLSGCQNDEKRAESIYSKLEQSAQSEKIFAERQQDLKKAAQDELSIYNDIMAQDIDQTDQMKQNIEDAQALNKRQKQFLKKLKHSFDDAYDVSSTIKSDVGKIKSSEQKKQAMDIVRIMENRRDLFHSYYDQCLTVLTLNSDLYKELNQEKFKATKLDEQIKNINQNYNDMKKQEEQFNHYTDQLNQAKGYYYKHASLDEKRLKQKKVG